MIHINKVGKIIKGDDVGCEIKITKATDGTGSYYILMSDNFSDPKTEKFDSWVESFEDANWVIEWQQ